MKKILLLFFVLAWVPIVRAQHYNIGVFTVEEGLPQSQVVDILQDRKGNLWVMTYGGGISKYDGSSFTNYSMREGLLSNTIYSAFEDRKGLIWIATGSGISRFDGYRFTNFTEKNGLTSDAVWSCLEDRRGDLWFGTDGSGILHYDGKAFKSFGKKEGLPNLRVWCSAEDADGYLWFGTLGGGLLRYDGKKFTQFTAAEGLADDRVWAITPDSKGNIWIATSKGASKITAGTNKFPLPRFINYSKNEGLLDQRLWSVMEDHKGNIWFGSQGGAFKGQEDRLFADTLRFTAFTTKEGLSNDVVWSLCEDREGNIWFGTSGGGLCRYSESRFVSFSEKDGLPSDLVFAISQDTKGNYWFGTKKGVSVFNGRTFTTYMEKDGLSNDNVYDIIEDRKGFVWIGTYNGACRFDGKKFTRYNYKTESGTKNVIYQVFEDHLGTIWLASQKGLVRMEEKNQVTYSVEQGLANNTVRNITEDSHHNLWVSTDGGLSEMIPSPGGKYNIVNFSHQDGLENTLVYSVIEDSRGILWIATRGGLFSYTPSPMPGKKGSFEQFTAADGLLDDNVVLTSFDDAGNLWIGTNKGICRFNLPEFRRSGRRIFKNYGRTEGFTGIECNQNAVYKDANRNIWFGTIRGAIRYNPREDFMNAVPPLVHITNLRLFSENVDWASWSTKSAIRDGLPEGLVLTYKKNHVTFDYIGISLTAPEKVRYQYLLEGFDNGWSPVTKEIHATYSNLPPGEYTFKVKAANNDGIWSSTMPAFHFMIEPPFYRTWWFYMLSALTLIAGIYFGVRWRISTLQAQRRKLEKMVVLRTSQLQEEKEKVEAYNVEVLSQKEIIEARNKDITDSIRYARRIQEAILPRMEEIRKGVPEVFVMYKPKAIVSGDFYWYTRKGGKELLAVVDCTGHGVPGAFMSMIGNSLLNEIVNERGILMPGEILKHLDEGVRRALQQDRREAETRDGMDISLSMLDRAGGKLYYAGAMRPLYYVRNGELKELKGDKMSIGGLYTEGMEVQFHTYCVEVKKGDMFYMFSDGYVDQFGGGRGRKYLAKRFQEMLRLVSGKDIEEQEKEIQRSFMEWKGAEEQIDDVLVIGFRPL